MRTVGLIIREQESVAEKYVCPHCGKEYKSAAALKSHVEKNHPQVFDEQE